MKNGGKDYKRGWLSRIFVFIFLPVSAEGVNNQLHFGGWKFGFADNFVVAGFVNFLVYEHLTCKLTGVSRIFKTAGESHRPLLLQDNRAIGFVYL